MLGDVWIYDAAAMGWEEVEFTTTLEYCPTSEPNLESPEPRAMAALVNTGSTGLMCGGYTVDGSTDEEGSVTSPIASSTNSSHIDCWWLTPLPAPRWDRLLLTADSPVPPPRYGVQRTLASAAAGAVN